MANFTPDDASGLRLAIQNATIGSTVLLTTGQTYSSITTLAKFTCYTPLTRTSNYTIDGNGGPSRSTVIENTRIYQQNIDGNLPPSTGVKNLTLNYTTGNTAILAATKGSYSIDNIKITGTHSGWAGNGGVYMSLIAPTASTNTNWITANLNLSNSLVEFTSNTQSDNASFLQSWNNNGTVTLNNNTFKEAGYNRGTFHFASMLTDGAASPISSNLYTITKNTFEGSGTNKAKGNRLESVKASVRGNTFNNGSFLDLYGNVANIVIDTLNNVTPNTFNTVYGASSTDRGCGVRFNKSSSSGATLSGTASTTFKLNNGVFTGYGLAIINNDSANGSVVIPNGGNNSITAGNLAAVTFDMLEAGGQGDDSLVGSAFPDWLSGDSGADSISANDGDDYIIGGFGSDSLTGGNGSDTFLYYDTNEGGDTITDFTTASDFLAFRGNTSGGSTFFNFAPSASLTTGTNFITSGSPGTTGPTFIYIGGVLSYDADGSGGGAAVNIATFTGSPTIAASDIKFF